MERKASLSPIPRNKKAPKAPESGTSRVGNQLVRMRSPSHSFKDMETGTAPTLALSNTDTSNTAETQETGGHTASCFFMPIANRAPVSRPPSHAPQGIQAPAIPTGTSSPHSSTVRRGIATARTKPLTPPYAQLPTTAHVSSVAGHPLPHPAQRHFQQHQKKY